MGTTKEEWIEAIRRLSAQEGKPIGREALLSKTGWKSEGWIHFWEKWSDAQIEAGYSPIRKNEAFAREHIVECLAKLAHKVGSYPTAIQVKRECRSNPDFPSHSVFDRLGGRADKLRCLKEFCHAKPEYEELLRALESEPIPEQIPLEPSPYDRAEEGYVYLLRYGTTQKYKVGRSKDAFRRTGEIGRQTPDPVTLVHQFKTDDASGIEAYWLNRFKKSGKHHRDEWFKLSLTDVSAFKRRKDFM